MTAHFLPLLKLPPVPVSRLHRLPAWAGWGASAGAVASAAWLTRHHPAWVMMVAISAAEFLALKFATLRDHARDTSPARLAGYLLAWPGLDARAFLRPRRPGAATLPRPCSGELAFAFAKLALGLGLATWKLLYFDRAPELLAGWVGMLGIIFTLHFGLFHVLSWVWRAVGVDAPPLMRAPIASTSLAEFWGVRWNVAFADAARRFLLRPLARRWGVARAGLAVFFVSGLVHETAISLPARGGWGGPTLYFLLHAVGLAFEKSALGLRLGLGRGWRGRLWTLLVAVAPLPLLFHAPFVRHVIVPLYRSFAALLP